MMGIFRKRVPATLCAFLTCALLTFQASIAAAELADVLPGLFAESAVVLIPATLTGPAGTGNGFGVADLGGDGTTDGLSSLTNSIFAQIQNLPIGTGVSSFTYTLDENSGLPVRESKGMGPILSDRSQTVGKGKLNVSLAFANANFDKFEGQPLSNLNVPVRRGDADFFFGGASGPDGGVGGNFNVFLYLEDPQGFAVNNDFNPTLLPIPQGGPTRLPLDPLLPVETFIGATATLENSQYIGNSTDGGYGIFSVANNGFEGDYIYELEIPDIDVNMALEVQVWNLAFDYGITDTIDVGLVVPLVRSQIDVSASVDLPVALDGNGDACVLADETNPFCFADYAEFIGFSALFGELLPPFPPGTPFTNADLGDVLAITAVQQIGRGSETSSGIGDVVVRGKWNFLQDDRVDMAVRAKVIFPSGNERDFHGTGNYIVDGMLVASGTYWKRFSPHANLGVRWVPGESQFSQFRFSAGGDVLVTDWLNLSVDVLGSEDFNPDGIGDSIYSIAPGLKINPWRELVVAFVGVVPLNDDGLRANWIPSVALEYTFF